MKDIGKKLMDIARWYSMPADHFSTIKEAVELLEQKPSYNSIKTELNDVAISRQAAIDAIENEQNKIMRSDWAIDQAKFSAMSEIRALIADLPSVSTEKTRRWIPVSERLPELNKPLFVTAYHRVCYAHMISKSGNYGYPVFRLHELKDSDRGWVQETISHEPYSKGRIDAWMYIDIPQPYKGESEE